MRGARPLSAVTLRLASACECRVLVREGTVTQLTGQRRLLLPLLRIFRDFARGVKPSHHKNKTKQKHRSRELRMESVACTTEASRLSTHPAPAPFRVPPPAPVVPVWEDVT